MSIQEKSNQSYKNLALNSSDLTQVAGRLKSMEGIEPEIYKDILNKLNLRKGDNFLDVGCGFGILTKYLLEYCQSQEIQTTLIDISEIIQRLQKEFKALTSCSQFYEGNFPNSLNKKIPSDTKFDKILTYSVLHYVSNPYEYINKLADLLAPGGVLLVGDIPNANKKGRFLSSHFGRKFDSEFKKVEIEKIPCYEDQFDYICKNESLNLLLTDSFLIDICKKYRSLNYEVYILPQQENMPFSYSREDLIIKKNLS